MLLYLLRVIIVFSFGAVRLFYKNTPKTFVMRSRTQHSFAWINRQINKEQILINCRFVDLKINILQGRIRHVLWHRNKPLCNGNERPSFHRRLWRRSAAVTRDKSIRIQVSRDKSNRGNSKKSIVHFKFRTISKTFFFKVIINIFNSKNTESYVHIFFFWVTTWRYSTAVYNNIILVNLNRLR